MVQCQIIYSENLILKSNFQEHAYLSNTMCYGREDFFGLVVKTVVACSRCSILVNVWAIAIKFESFYYDFMGDERQATFLKQIAHVFHGKPHP